MIENIRKYNGLIILGLVVIAVALVVGLQSSSMRGPGGGQPYLKIGNRTYTDDEYKQLGLAAIEVASDLARVDRFSISQFVYSLSPEAIGALQTGDMSMGVEQFFVSRMLVRQAKNELGVHPSEDEISAYTRSLRSFSTPDGAFDAEAYGRFVEDGIGRLGMTEKDFRELISDIIATDKIRAIIGSGLPVLRDAIVDQHLLNSQQITGSVARLDITPLREALDPSDEELKTYWELIQDAFKTEEQRRFSYILVAPEMPAAEEAAVDDGKKSLAEAAMTDEAKEKAAKEKAEKEAAIAELRREKQRQLDLKFDTFTSVLEEQDGSGFEELAKEYQWQLKTTELFNRSNPPADLALSVRSGNRSESLVEELFRITLTADPISKFSQPMGVGENQWLVARLEEVVPARTKTFEEAHEAVRTQYINEKAAKALEEAINEAAEKIKAAMESGKSFIDASIDAGLTEMKPFVQIDAQYRGAPPEEPENLFMAARTVDPGGLSEPLMQYGHAYLIHVATREVIMTDEIDQQIDQQVYYSDIDNRMRAFSDWIAFRTEAAEVKPYYQK